MVFETTRTLAPREGLTIAVAFPKGSSPNREPRCGSSGRCGTMSGSSSSGSRCSPPARISTPPGTGSAATRKGPHHSDVRAAGRPVSGRGELCSLSRLFHGRRRGPLRAFIAALMSLAVKKRIRIDDQGGTVALTSIWTGTGTLPGGEAAIMSKLLPGGRFEFTKANGEIGARCPAPLPLGHSQGARRRLFQEQLWVFHRRRDHLRCGSGGIRAAGAARRRRL
jgi:hypothetical protein